MNAAQSQYGRSGAAASAQPRSLRATLEARSRRNETLPLEAVVAQLVPLCSELAEIHAQGYGFYLHGSSVAETPDGRLVLAREMATQMPTHPNDVACMPPETRADQLNDARANVYALGALFYELVTGECVGRGMKRPQSLVPTLPSALDNVLSAALITDPNHRPGDLLELARSIHQLARPGSVPPPGGDPPSNFRPSHPISIDVSLSLLPPEPTQHAAAAPQIIDTRQAAPASSVNGYGVAVQAAQVAPPASTSAAAAHLAALKAQLEADPTPRYFVVKAGMDHGPFTAIELVRHIDGHSFTDEDKLLDNVDGREGIIGDFPQFAQFAEHAKKRRHQEQRQKDIVQVAAAERKSSRSKTLIGLLVLLGVVATAGGWFVIDRGVRRDTVAVQTDESTNVETDSALSMKGKKGRRGKRSSRAKSGSGSIPIVSGGKSCQAAMDSYNEIKIVGQKGQADITAGQYGRVLNSGSYFSHCGVPFSMTVNICAAVQNGRAVGVTVSTTPHNAKKVGCISSAVRRLSFPSHPKLDVTRTAFKGQ